MKSIGLAFIALIVGTLANPLVPSPSGSQDERIVTGQIIKVIEDLSQKIKDDGLDPFEFSGEAKYELPVPILFAASAFVDTFVFTGLSNIAVNQMNFSILTTRLTFDLSLPRLAVSIANSGFEVVLFGRAYEGSAKGSLEIIQPRIVGEIRINLGVISGISVSSLALTFSLESIDSNLEVELLNQDISERLNNFLGTTVPATLKDFESEINQLLHIVVWGIIEENVNTRLLI